jgi:glycerol-3-phosphate dehydrogenase
MNMIAEGYYAVNCLHQVNRQYKVDMPICEAVYAILYKKAAPRSRNAETGREIELVITLI